MSKTYVLESTSMLGGTNSTYRQDWRLSKRSGAGTSLQITQTKQVNMLFDLDTLALLRTKTINSIELDIYVDGYLPYSNQNLVAIAYKYNSGVGATTDCNDWARSDPDSTALSTSNYIGFIKSDVNESYRATNFHRHYDISGKIVPKYGFCSGAHNSSFNGSVYIRSPVTLTVVTAESDFSYLLTYDVNGGTGTFVDQSGSNNQLTPSYTFTLSNTIPTRLGYNFLGWDLSSTATAASYQPGDSITVTTDGTTTIYAVWECANTIRIVNNNILDLYTMNIVNSTGTGLESYRVMVVNSAGTGLDIYT